MDFQRCGQDGTKRWLKNNVQITNHDFVSIQSPSAWSELIILCYHLKRCLEWCCCASNCVLQKMHLIDKQSNGHMFFKICIYFSTYPFHCFYHDCLSHPFVPRDPNAFSISGLMKCYWWHRVLRPWIHCFLSPCQPGLNWLSILLWSFVYYPHLVWFRISNSCCYNRVCFMLGQSLTSLVEFFNINSCLSVARVSLFACLVLLIRRLFPNLCFRLTLSCRCPFAL